MTKKFNIRNRKYFGEFVYGYILFYFNKNL